MLDIENLPDNYDWASVDWDRIVKTRVFDTGDGNSFEEYTYAWELVGYAIERRYDYDLDEYLYSELDEEAKTIIEKLLELSKEELTSIYVVFYPIPDNYDWTSVDWNREIGTSTSGWDNYPMHATSLLRIVGSVWRYNLFPEINQNPNEEKKTAEELMNEYLKDTSIGTYDGLDEESKMLVDKLLEVEPDFEIMLNLERYVQHISWLE